MIVGNRHSIIEYAVNTGVKLIVIIGNGEIKKEHLEIAKKNKVNIISTSYNTLETTKIFNLCNNVTSIINENKVLCVNENDDINDFIKLANKTRYSYYPVLNKNNKCLGILRLSDASFSNKKNVILVDHNSYEQSAIGLEDANILEIIDHHNIGTIGTNMPISFRNMPVGSTNTIIYKLYKEKNIKIDKDIAGLMLSGILSDTLILKSPTTTEYDINTVKDLANILDIDYQKYGIEMFKAGSSLAGLTKDEIITTDIKSFWYDDEAKYAISQVITLNTDDILNSKEDYIKELEIIKENHDYKFVIMAVTDPIKGGSYFIFTEDAKKVIESGYVLDNIKQGHYIKGQVSRKKQIVPIIMTGIGRLD